MPPSTAVATQEESQPLTLQQQIIDGLQAHKGEVRAFLPNEDAQRRFMRIVVRALDESPRLRQATPDSIVRAALEAAVYGLEPSGAIGGAHLVPFKNNDTGNLEAQLITDYRGDVHLARQSKEVVDAYAEVVRLKDRFVDDRAQANVIHEPDLTAPRTNNPDDPANPITAGYACVVFTSGFRRFVVMTKAEVDAIREMAPGRNSPAWRLHYPEMMKKTLLKRALKTAPLPPMVRSLISREDTLDYTEPVRATVERPRGQALADRLQQQRQIGTNEQPADGHSAGEPQQEAADGAPSASAGPAEAKPEPAAPSVGAAPANQEPAQPAAGAPSQEGRESVAAGSATPDEADEPAEPKPDEQQAAAASDGENRTSEAGLSSPAASTLQALQLSPSQETFLVFAAHELGIEEDVVIAFADLTEADLEQVIAAIGTPDDYKALHKRLPAALKALLKSKHQSPGDREQRGGKSRQQIRDEAEAQIARVQRGEGS